VREIHCALRQNLEQCHRQTWAAHNDVVNFGRGPCHQLGVLQRCSLLGAVRKIQECRLSEKFVRLIDVDDHLVTVIGKTRYLNFPIDNEIDAGGGLILIVDHLALPVLQNARAGKMRQRIFELLLRYS